MSRKLVTVVIAAALTLPSQASAQSLQTALDVTGFPLTFSTPTIDDFDAGFIASPTPVTFTINAVSGTSGQRTATVSIRCSAPCPTQGTKSMSTLRWARVDLMAWQTLQTSDAIIESRAMFKGSPPPGSNDPWSNSIIFQFLLDWGTDLPSATVNRFDIVMTLTVTAP
jgi:hypothetical protein